MIEVSETQRASVPPDGAQWRHVLQGMAAGNSSLLPVSASLLVIAVFFQIESPYFLSPTNLSNLSVQLAIVAAVALGEVVVLLLGEIDLSLGSVSGATAALLGVLLASTGLPWWATILIMLLCGTLMGTTQGVWVGAFGVPSFVVTLAGLLSFLGLQLAVLGSNGTLTVTDEHILGLTSVHVPPKVGYVLAALFTVLLAVSRTRQRVERRRRQIRHNTAIMDVLVTAGVGIMLFVVVATLNVSGGVPLAFAVLVTVVGIVWWVSERTIAGRRLYAVGGDSEAARRAGIRLSLVRISAFSAAGTLGAFAGLLDVSYNQSAGTLTGGGTLLLEAIGAAVIGGCSLFGGRGSAWAALFGALVLAGVSNGLDLTNHAAPLKYIVEGIIVLLAVSFDTFVRHLSSTNR